MTSLSLGNILPVLGRGLWVAGGMLMERGFLDGTNYSYLATCQYLLHLPEKTGMRLTCSNGADARVNQEVGKDPSLG